MPGLNKNYQTLAGLEGQESIRKTLEYGGDLGISNDRDYSVPVEKVDNAQENMQRYKAGNSQQEQKEMLAI